MLKKVVALITGGAGTLGFAAAERLVSGGAKVTLLDLPASKGAELAESLGSNAKFCPADILSEEEVSSAIKESVQTFGKFNTLVNCAGQTSAHVIFNFNKKTTANLEDLTKGIQVNICGTLNVIRLAATVLSENPPDEGGCRGLIINTSGFAAFDGMMGQVGVSASWGAIASMTLPLCRDFSPAGIRVMTIAPGIFQSNLTMEIPTKVVRSLGLITPTPKRLGSGEDFAHLVQCIIENQFLNGEVIRLDGGLRANLF